MLLPAERHPTRRNAADVPDEGVLRVAGLKEMGELVAALTERAETEKRERELLYAGADTGGAEEMDIGGGGKRPMPPPTEVLPGGMGGPEAPPEDDEDD